MEARKQFNLEQTIESVTNILNQTKNGAFPELLTMKIRNLEALKATLEQLRVNDNQTDINKPFEMQNILNSKTITCLNIAVTYCEAPVVEFLFSAGAKADQETIHHATATRWPNIDQILDVLVAHGVDLNTTKDGHTALYNTKRHSVKCGGQMQPVVNSLVQHHATMFARERLSEPLLRLRDQVSDTYDAITGFMPFPR